MRRSLLALLLVAGCTTALNDPASRIARALPVFVEGAAPASTLTPAEASKWAALGAELLDATAQLESATR